MTRKYKVVIFFLIIISCKTYEQPVFIGNWNENKFEFSESINFNELNRENNSFRFLKWCGCIENEYQWLRNENNLQAFYNTIKKIGIENFISKKEYNQIVFESDYWNYDWNNLSLNQIVKNFINSYKKETSSKYYSKFWARRKAEKNDQIVFQILYEIDNHFNKGEKLDFENYLINQELHSHVEETMRFIKSDSLSIKKNTLEYFNFLKKKGLNHSAYNLIYELKETQKVKLNRDSLLITIKHDTIPETLYWQTRNNSEWIQTYFDDGP